MRTLARALHELRRFLPPAVAPAGQRLTKIETLRLAIRYIGHLSAVLGLSDDGLQRRRRRADAASPRGCCCCPLCPDGGPGGGPGSGGPSLGSAICHGATWESPPTRPGPQDLGSSVSNADPWITPPYCPKILSPQHQSLGRAPDAASPWTASPQVCPQTQTSPGPGNRAAPWTPPPAPPELTEVYQVGSGDPGFLWKGGAGIVAGRHLQGISDFSDFGESNGGEDEGNLTFLGEWGGSPSPRTPPREVKATTTSPSCHPAVLTPEEERSPRIWTWSETRVGGGGRKLAWAGNSKCFTKRSGRGWTGMRTSLPYSSLKLVTLLFSSSFIHS
jgi:hypothetical protein